MLADLEVPRHLSDRECWHIEQSSAVQDADRYFGRIAAQPRFEVRTPDGGRVVAEGNTPWLGGALRKLLDLLSLPANWDSYGAQPVMMSHVHATIELLRWVLPPDGVLPQFIPTVHGRVQLEWHRRNIDLEIEVMGPDSFDVLYENAASGETWEGVICSDLSRLKQFVAEAAKQ